MAPEVSIMHQLILAIRHVDGCDSARNHQLTDNVPFLTPGTIRSISRVLSFQIAMEAENGNANSPTLEMDLSLSAIFPSSRLPINASL